MTDRQDANDKAIAKTPRPWMMTTRIHNTLALLLCVCVAYGQQTGYYAKGEQAYKAHQLDDAVLYLDSAIESYQRRGLTDSLVFAVAYKARVLVDRDGIAEAGSYMATHLPIVDRLPAKSPARVAAYNRIGQIRSHQYKLDEASEWLEKGLQALDTTAAPHPHQVALYIGLSQLYMTKQQYAKADEYIGKAYTANLELEGADGVLMVNIWQMRYFASFYARDYNQALEHGREFERAIDLHYPPDHPNTGMMHNSLSEAYLALGIHDQALRHQHQAVGIHYQNYLQTGNSYTLAGAYSNLGGVYYALHEYYLADEYLGKAIGLMEAIFGEYGPGMVETLVMLGSTKQKLKRFADAEEIFSQAYRLQSKHAPYERHWLAYIEGYYADCYYDQKRFREAVEYYRRAIATYRSIGQENTYYGLYSKVELGAALGHTEAWEEALDIQREALADFRRHLPKLENIAPLVWSHISTTHGHVGHYTNALAYSDSVFAYVLGLNELPGDPAAWMAQLPYSFNSCKWVANRLYILWELYLDSGQQRDVQEILAIVDAYGNFFAGNLYSMRSQASLIEQADINKRIYGIGMEACWQLYDNGADERYARKGFEYAEQSKAILLRLASNNLMVQASEGNSDPIAQRDGAFQNRIGSLNEQYLNAGGDSLLNLLSHTLEEYRVFQDSLKQSGHTAFAAKYDIKPHGIDAVRAELLGNNEALLHYTVTDEAVYSFVVTQTDFRMKRANTAILEGIKQLQNLYALPAGEFATIAHRLYQELVAPLAPYHSAGKLLVVPDGDLHYLNFEILLPTDEHHGFDDMAYLIHEYDISYLLSASSAIQFKEAFKLRKKNSRALLFAPVFSDEMKNRWRQSRSEYTTDNDDYLMLSRQPFSIQTAKAAGNLFAHDLYAEQAAQEHTFKQAAEGYNILHLATHAEMNDLAPLQSRLFFAKPLPDDTANADDGYLHAYEIYAMQLRAELAVLTACETGLGLYRHGEGVLSLAHSFMHAGCPSVVMSLWKIDEKTSAAIISKFYEHLSKGLGKSEALRQAKLDFIAGSVEELKHPYYWAGLALIGDPAPIVTDSSIPYWLWGLVALGVVVVVFRKRFFPGKSR